MLKKFLYLFAVVALNFASAAFAQSACTVSSGAITDTNANCQAQPEGYKTTIYKLMLCTSLPTAPTNGAAIDLSSCSTVFQNDSGAQVGISLNGSTQLSGTITKPPNGSYSHAVAVISPQFQVKATFTFSPSRSNYGNTSSGVVCWSKAGDFFGNRTSRVSLVDCGGAVGAGYDYTTTNTNGADYVGGAWVMSKDFGSVIVHLVTSSMTLATSTSDSLGNVSKVIGVVPASSPWVVTDATKNFDISFSVSRGATVEMNGINPKIEAFSVGPFLPVITLN